MKKLKKIYIEITNICNLNCSFCSKNSRKKENMTLEEFKQILEKIKHRTESIYLHVTGEPLLHPNFEEILSIIDKYNMRLNITTNGTLLKDKIASLNNCNSLAKINISLHSENHDKNYYNQVFNSVSKLENKVVIYRLWTLQNNKLDKQSTEIVEKIKNYYNLSTEIVDKLKTDKNVKINSTIYVDKDNLFKWPDSESDRKTDGFCHALKTHIAILVDGTVVPCCLDANKTISLGNIFEEELDTIINSKKYQDLRKSFQDRKPCEDLCRSCTFKEKLVNK